MSPVASVAAPPVVLPRFSLVAAAGEAADQAARWEGGLAWANDWCTSDGGTSDPCTTLDFDNAAPECEEFEATPYLIWEPFKNSTFGNPSDEELRNKATARLLQFGPGRIEAEFWLGTRAQAAAWSNQYLRDANAVDLTTAGAAQPLLRALSNLQEAIIDNFRERGMIHATPRTVSLWWAHDALRREGNLLLDVFDNIIVPGAGYDGSSTVSTDATGDSAWAFATPMVTVRQTPIVADVGFDQTNNLKMALASRYAIAYWRGCDQYMTNVDHNGAVI